MKKFFIGTAAVLALTLSAVGLAACGSNGEGNGNHEHTLVKHEAVEKTCTEAGSKLYWECSDCGKLYLDEQAANETTLDAVVVAAGHTEELLPGRAATCTETGLTEGAKCSVCGETLVAQEEIAVDPTAHNYELKFNESEHWYECACGEEKDHEAHKGGTATSTKRAECEVCGEEYGDFGTGGDPNPNPPAGDTKYTGVATKYTADLGLVTLTGSADKQNGYGTSGTFIGNLTSGSTITYTFESTYEGMVEIFLAAAGQNSDWGGAIEGAFTVYVNGNEEAIATIDVGTNGWTNFTEIFIGKAELIEGVNTIEFVAGENTNAHVNVDYLLVAPLPDSTYAGEDKKFGSELAVLENCTLQANAAGMGGYVVDDIVVGSKITYKIDSSVEEIVTLIVSVAGTQTQDKAFEVTVNGTSFGTFDIGTTGWHEVSLGETSLKEDENTIVIVFNSANYQFNYLKLEPFKSYSGTEMIIGAGKASTQGGCSVEDNGLGYDGHIVGGIADGNGSVISFTVNSAVDANVSLVASLAGGTFDWAVQDWAPLYDGSFEIVVNGQSVGTLSFMTMGWTDFTEFNFGTVSLNAGVNTIELRATSGNANLNYIKLVAEA